MLGARGTGGLEPAHLVKHTTTKIVSFMAKPLDEAARQ